MAIDTIYHVQATGRKSAYLDWLQMLTGAGLILFMWSHMILVASVNLGAGAMNTLAYFFEATYMAQVGGPLIGATMLLHFVLAARKIPFRAEQQSTIWKHAQILHHRDTWLWLIQAFTAMIILIMGAIHMWTVLTDLPITAQKSAARIQGGVLAGLLPDPSTHGGTPRGNRVLPHRCEMGAYQTQNPRQIPSL